MTERFTVTVRVEGEVGLLEWDGLASPDELQAAVARAAGDQLAGGRVRRLECNVPATDATARRALHRSGFRREGVRRQLQQVRPGEYVDVVMYSRLASDSVEAPDTFSSVMDTVLPTKRLIAHVFFRNARDEVLLLETGYKSDWELPGGVVEPGEPPRVGAEREVQEELGLDVHLAEPAMVDWMPPYLGWSDAIDFLYDGGVLDEQTIAALRPDGIEVRAVHWVAEADLDAHVTPLSARRHRLLLAGFRGATEDGIPMTGEPSPGR